MTNTTPTSGGPTGLTDEQLNAMRKEGDPYADGLAAKIFGEPALHAEPGSRLGYNKLVDIADLLDSDAELLLIHDSNFAKALAAFPQEFQDYYDPMDAPDWVDVTKLELASELWKENSIAMLGILYAASLPACYLMKNGIPALYQTAKLKDQKYIFQRIYETGLMLDAVMSPGGIKVIQDARPDADDLFLQTLAQSTGGNWVKEGDKFVKVSGGGFESNDETANLSPKELARATHERAQLASKNYRVTTAQRSYIWGRGYIAAKKVRMLHASMRYMLLNPGVMRPRRDAAGAMADKFAQAHGSDPWPTEQLGVPVNQEDLAFTLLTFSYIIPRGMEMIGCQLSVEQKEAFLHLWRVVGHVMGLRSELMTDKWDEAKDLYERIHRLQAGSSPEGIALTETVMGFLKSYLPNAFGISKRIPVALIAAQMGPDARLLMGPENLKVLDNPLTHLSMAVTRFALRFFYNHYQRLLYCLPVLKRVFGDLLFRSSEQLVLSWRDEYSRKPFYVPITLNTWQLQRGVDDAFRARVQGWRQHLFFALGSALLAIWIMFAGFTLGVIGWFAHWPDITRWSFIAMIIGFLYSVFEIDMRIPAIFAKRPVPEGVSTRGK